MKKNLEWEGGDQTAMEEDQTAMFNSYFGLIALVVIIKNKCAVEISTNIFFLTLK